MERRRHEGTIKYWRYFTIQHAYCRLPKIPASLPYYATYHSGCAIELMERKWVDSVQ